MNPLNLLGEIRKLIELVGKGELANLDLSQLSATLKQVADLIEDLSRKVALADSLIRLFRDELINRARAVAMLTGKSSRLIERLVSDETLALDELLALKRDIDSTFDQAFKSNLSETKVISDDQDKLAQYKVG